MAVLPHFLPQIIIYMPVYEHVKGLYKDQWKNQTQINSVFSSPEIVCFNFSKIGNKCIALLGTNRSKSSEDTDVFQTQNWHISFLLYNSTLYRVKWINT